MELATLAMTDAEMSFLCLPTHKAVGEVCIVYLGNRQQSKNDEVAAMGKLMQFGFGPLCGVGGNFGLQSEKNSRSN